jgi:predicted cupin superfamily sugar epimerase
VFIRGSKKERQMMHKRATELIKQLNLSPHPEGGYFKEVYRSEQIVVSPVNNEQRNAVTDIYFLLCTGQVSRFHKVLHDEIWNFYEGDPLKLIEVDAESMEVSEVILGDKDSVQYKHCIKADNWQAAETTGEYSLVGCTVAPGFDFADFSFLSDCESAQLEFLSRCNEYAKYI